MLSLDAAFDRIGSALRQMGYTFAREEKPSDAAGDRVGLWVSFPVCEAPSIESMQIARMKSSG